MDGEELQRVLRELFEAQVMNHGDYNLVYGQPSGPGPVLVIGYRRTPLELVLCPVDLGYLPQSTDDGHNGGGGGAARPAGSISSITLADVATVADTGTGYQVQSVTGFRTWFEVVGAPQVPVGAAVTEAGDGTVVLQQGQDAEDFHEFMAHFMDTLDAFYQVPEATESPRTLPASD